MPRVSPSIYSGALIDVKFDDAYVTDIECMYNVARLTVKKAALKKHPKLLIKIHEDLVAFGTGIEFDLNIKPVSKQALEFAIPSFYERKDAHHEFRAKLCEHLQSLQYNVGTCKYRGIGSLDVASLFSCT